MFTVEWETPFTVLQSEISFISFIFWQISQRLWGKRNYSSHPRVDSNLGQANQKLGTFYLPASNNMLSLCKSNINQTVCSYLSACQVATILQCLPWSKWRPFPPSHIHTHTFTHLILHIEEITSSFNSQMFPLGDSKYSICVAEEFSVCAITV